ncbi:ribokinase [Mycetocola spongiae]|uniref:ribokinase n=1 Tax=Mycetocola spongiae TaxID=2859226 RepID=UPI001CF0E8E3|nr:ribokinase [Mycetocola spongiae]UCR89070.1 ribokinase [Mycetocola spongiae]
MTDSRIIVVGSLNADLVVHTERFPQPGETLHGSELVIVPGGKGANQAVAAGRLGGDVAMIGAVGVGDHGDLLLASTTEAGVDVSHVTRLEGVATGTAVINVDGAGENIIIVSPGANGRLGEAEISAAAGEFVNAKVLCLALEVPMDTVLAAARRGHETGTTVMMNLSPYGPVPQELLGLTDILLLNEHEASDLLGTDVEAAGWDATALALAGRGVTRAVITVGAAGAIVIDNERAPEAISSPRVEAVDTTGCGDAFMGALALRLAAGDGLADAARFAATVGSYAATGEGAQASYPTPAQLEEFLATRR